VFMIIVLLYEILPGRPGRANNNLASVCGLVDAAYYAYMHITAISKQYCQHSNVLLALHKVAVEAKLI
jgi:hypothetical protein